MQNFLNFEIEEDLDILKLMKQEWTQVVTNPEEQGGEDDEIDSVADILKITNLVDPGEFNDADGDGIDDDLQQGKLDSFLSNIMGLDSTEQPKEQPDKIGAIDEEDDNPDDDEEGEERDWNNWVIDSFVPKGGITLKASGGSNLVVEGQEHLVGSSAKFVAECDEFNQILNQHNAEGKEFSDFRFPAQDSSILGRKNDPSSQAQFGRLEWARPGEIFNGEDFCIFDSSINPNDIAQGMLGNCYYLSAIAAVAENASRVKKIFLNQSVNSPGVYCVALCINGLWEEVILDDQFPVHGYSKAIAFNKSTSAKNEIWVMLIEKAWAKVHGGYLNTDGGLTREALHDLTGAPCKTFFTKAGNRQAHWQELLQAEQNNFIMTASSDNFNQSGNDARDAATGLSACHAYSLLAAYEVENSSGQYRKAYNSNANNLRIVKLRNPWGKGEWNHDWNDSDSRWNQQLSAEVGHTYEEDGTFFMPWEKFLHYFNDFQICYYYDHYEYSAQRYNTSPTRPTFLEFEVTTPGKYYFSVNQINRRFFRPEDSKILKLVTILTS